MKNNSLLKSKRKVQEKSIDLSEAKNDHNESWSESGKKFKENSIKNKKMLRQQNSLNELTKEFIEFVIKNGNQEIDINKIVNSLKVKKRRIYDITNVLEGIGLIKKVAKNKIIWNNKEYIGNINCTNKLNKNENKLLELEEENLLLNKYNELLDNQISLIEKNEKSNLFLLYKDLNKLNLDKQKYQLGFSSSFPIIQEPMFINDTKSLIQSTKEDMRSDRIQKNETLLNKLKYKHRLYLTSDSPISLYDITSKLREINIFKINDTEKSSKFKPLNPSNQLFCFNNNFNLNENDFFSPNMNNINNEEYLSCKNFNIRKSSFCSSNSDFINKLC